MPFPESEDAKLRLLKQLICYRRDKAHERADERCPLSEESPTVEELDRHIAFLLESMSHPAQCRHGNWSTRRE